MTCVEIYLGSQNWQDQIWNFILLTTQVISVLKTKWPLSKHWLCTIGVQFFLQDPASKLESTSQKLGHVSRVAEFFEVSVVRVPLWWLPTSTMKSKPVQVLPSSIQSEDPVLTSTCFYCGLGGQGFHEGMNQLCENFKHSYIPEDDSFRAFMISFC